MSMGAEIMSRVVDFSKIKNDKPIEEYPDGTVFVMRDSKPHYILEPFESIYPGDPRYDEALTYEEVLKKIN